MRGKTVVVTGAGGGLGRATALALAQANANLCIVDINRDGLTETEQQLREFPVDIMTCFDDLADIEGCKNIIAKTLDKFSRLDGLCNIAAVLYPTHTISMTEEQWNKTIAVNLSAPFHLIAASLAELEKNSGAVVNVTSCAAGIGQPYLAAYSAAKAGLTQLTKSLAMEYMNRKVRFNVVAPGGMPTAITEGMKNLKDPDLQLLGRVNPIRGMVEIDDVAAMTAFLVSDNARCYHGAVINIDNGIVVG